MASYSNQRYYYMISTPDYEKYRKPVNKKVEKSLRVKKYSNSKRENDQRKDSHPPYRSRGFFA
jgi:hypothetical protein